MKNSYEVIQVSGINDNGQPVCSFPTHEAAQKYINAVAPNGGWLNDNTWLEIVTL